MYKSISFNDPEFATKLTTEFISDGVVVITDVIDAPDCDTYMDNIIDDFVKLNTGIKKDDIINTWKDENLPSQTRAGLFQALMSNLQSVWAIRSNNNISNIFEILYTKLRNKPITDFIVSGDGINIKPGVVGPFVTPNTKDWAHVDQTTPNDIYKCIQGQAVLTNTSASFVATPKSHLSFDQILKELKISTTDKSNWIKFTEDQLKIVKNIIPNNNWQLPILAPKGSFIVWSSTTIHSARLQSAYTEPTINDKYYGWRGVVYVCYRPKSEMDDKHVKKRKEIYDNNRVMNHWSTKMFSKKPGMTYNMKKNNDMEKLLNDPLLVYEKLNKPILDDKQKKLIGL